MNQTFEVSVRCRPKLPHVADSDRIRSRALYSRGEQARSQPVSVFRDGLSDLARSRSSRARETVVAAIEDVIHQSP